jgi:hypothetical protein
MKIHITKNGQTLGPYDTEEVNKQLKAGIISSSDMAWQEGMSEWRPLSTLPGIQASVFSETMPIAQPPTIAGGSKGIITGGYVCAAISLLFLPPGFGIAGLVLGIIALTRGRTGHGIAIIVLSVSLAFFGMLIGAAMWN